MLLLMLIYFVLFIIVFIEMFKVRKKMSRNNIFFRIIMIIVTQRILARSILISGKHASEYQKVLTIFLLLTECTFYLYFYNKLNSFTNNLLQKRNISKLFILQLQQNILTVLVFFIFLELIIFLSVDSFIWNTFFRIIYDLALISRNDFLHFCFLNEEQNRKHWGFTINFFLAIFFRDSAYLNVIMNYTYTYDKQYILMLWFNSHLLYIHCTFTVRFIQISLLLIHVYNLRIRRKILDTFIYIYIYNSLFWLTYNERTAQTTKTRSVKIREKVLLMTWACIKIGFLKILPPKELMGIYYRISCCITADVLGRSMKFPKIYLLKKVIEHIFQRF